MKKLHSIFNRHFEWAALAAGLILLASADPYSTTGFSLCLFENLGIYCPGDGLGHSVSFIFRGLWREAWYSNPLGYPAIFILSSRIIYLLYYRVTSTIKPKYHGQII